MAAAQPNLPHDVDEAVLDADGSLDDTGRADDWPWAAVAASICALAFAVPYWAADYSVVENGGLATFAVPVIATLAATALILSALHLASKLETAIALCVPAPLVVLARVLMDTADDPTTHSLWPLELGVAVGISVPPALAGIFIGWLARRALGFEREVAAAE
jgi:hypothetical protein